MAKKRSYHPTFLKEWRRYRRLTQQQLADRVEIEPGKTVGASTISELERGKQGYTQGMLEAVAVALDCTPSDIINKNPLIVPPEYWQVIEGLKPERQRRALEILKLLLDQDAA